MWIRYNPGAVPDLNFRKSTSFTMPLTKILAAPRTPLPYRSSAAWWNVPGPLQPLASRTWEAFTPDYKQQLDNAVSTAAATGSAAVGKGSTSVMRYLKELRLPTTRMSHPTDVSHFNLYYYWKLRKGGAGAAVANGSSGVAVMGRQPMELRALQQRPLHLLLDERAKSAARSFLRRHAARAASLAKISGSQAAQGRREPDGVAAARVLLRGPTSAHRLRALKGPLPLAQ